jgi:hypothetical protein
MLIYLRNEGPMIKYGGNGAVWINDLNPELETCWRMSRWERLVVGLRFALSALHR